MPVMFLSYRRSDSQDVTGRIYDRLVAKYTAPKVFKDVDSIPLGVSFPKHLQQVLSKASIVLVIIGPNWVHAADERGRRRLDDPNDFVRVEVECALRGKIPVIPILVSGAQMPTAAELPPSMQGLTARNGMSVRPDPDFHNDITRLISGIEKLDKLMQATKGKSKPGAVPEVIPVDAGIFDAELVRPPNPAPPRPSQAGREKPSGSKGRDEEKESRKDQSRSKGKSDSRNDEDRPRPIKKGSSSILLVGLIGGGMVAVLGCTCAGFISYFLASSPSGPNSPSGPDIIGRWEFRMPDVIAGKGDFLATSYEFRRGGTGSYHGFTDYEFNYRQNGDRVSIDPIPNAMVPMPPPFHVLVVRRSNEFLFVRQEGEPDELMLKKAF